MLYRICILAAFLLPTITHGQNNLVGKWIDKAGQENGYFRLDSSGYAIIVLNNDTLGGKEFMINGHKASLAYEVDSISVPFKIDFIATDLDYNKEAGRLLGIFTFITKERIRLCVNFNGGDRPLDFSEKGKGETYILTKAK
jgi:hypothetical protein